MTNIILASQSSQRKMLFKTLNIPFEVIPADLDEAAIQDVDLIKRAEKLARIKAETVAIKHPDSIIVAADTFVIDSKIALEKPKTKEEAIAMLQHQSGKTLQEVTGFCYLDPTKKINYSTAVITEVTFRNLSGEEIVHYVSTQPVTTWSGAFCPAYPEGMVLIARINGSFTGFTHGLPMEELVPQLIRSGVLK